MKRQWIMMSVSALMVCCLFVFMPGNVFASQSTGANFYKTYIFPLAPSTATGTSDSTIYASMMCTVLKSERIPQGNTGDIFEVQSIHKFIIRNTLDTDIMLNNTNVQVMMRISNNQTSAPQLLSIDWIDGQLVVDRAGTGGIFYFSNAPEYSLESNIVVPAHSDIACVFRCTWSTNEASAGALSFNDTYVYMYNPTQSNFRYTTGSWHTSYESYLPDIYEALGGQNSEAGAVQEESEDVNDQMDDIHQEESQYYDDAETDVSAVLTGFSFSTSDRGVIGVAVNQLNDIWSQMPAQLIMVPITGLSLKVATTILRHTPRRRKEDGKSD